MWNGEYNLLQFLTQCIVGQIETCLLAKDLGGKVKKDLVHSETWIGLQLDYECKMDVFAG